MCVCVCLHSTRLAVIVPFLCRSVLQVFNRLQELDEKRTRGMKEFIKRSADVEYEVSPIIAHCLEGIVKAADSINEKDDSMIVIEKYVQMVLGSRCASASVLEAHLFFACLRFRYQSGFQPPGDIPFEDLSKPDPDAANNSQTHNSSTGLNHMTGKGTTKDKLKKRVGIFGIFTGNKVSETATGSTGSSNRAENYETKG